MFRIEYSDIAANQIDEILSDSRIYDVHGHFTQQFANWNSEFYRYINPSSIFNQRLGEHGTYQIGVIGWAIYNCFILDNTEVFEIIEFRFSKLPYTRRRTLYNIGDDAGFGYKIIQSTFNGKVTLLTPQRRYLTKFVFDDIIGFHHSSDDYNTVYAVGFMGDRAYAIFQDGTIEVLPYTKEQYLKGKHNYYESKQYKPSKIMLSESQLRKLVRETLKRYLALQEE